MPVLIIFVYITDLFANSTQHQTTKQVTSCHYCRSKNIERVSCIFKSKRKKASFLFGIPQSSWWVDYRWKDFFLKYTFPAGSTAQRRPVTVFSFPASDFNRWRELWSVEEWKRNLPFCESWHSWWILWGKAESQVPGTPTTANTVHQSNQGNT